MYFEKLRVGDTFRLNQIMMVKTSYHEAEVLPSSDQSTVMVAPRQQVKWHGRIDVQPQRKEERDE